MIPRLFIHTIANYGMNEERLVLEIYNQDGEVMKDRAGKMHFETVYKQYYRDRDPMPFIRALRNLEAQLIRHYEAARCKEKEETETMQKSSDACVSTLKLAS